ncbi:MAG TPA: serine/threonine-protein kinase [Phycisphaerales bacterium]|nr:serine/threonine-protein kinase [Phycisphaerales bacterium]
MGEVPASNLVLSATRFHDGGAGEGAARVSTPPPPPTPDPSAHGSVLGFDLEDEAWMGLVRESIAAPQLGDFAGYRLLGEVGRGAQGAVFRAVQPGTGREVALKHLAGGPLAGIAAKERFDREVSVLSGLRHPAIVSVYGVIETPAPSRHAALVMEFVDGVTIDEWARGRGVRERVAAVATVCSAIAYAHQRGVIHRDIKPSNVLVDGEGQPRVLDFGLAAIAAARGSRTGPASVVGTPAFAAPEQITTGLGAVDTRSDVYALGCLLYVVLTGQLPHRGDGTVRDVAAPSPARVDRRLPTDLCAIVTTAMAPEPALRYQSADAMLSDLRRFLAGQAVLAHPATVWYRAAKVVRRRPVLSAVVAACVLGVLASAVVSTVLAVRLAARSEALAAAVRQSETSAAEARESAARSAALAATLRDTLNSISESMAASAPGSVFEVTRGAMAKIEELDERADPVLVESLWYDVGRVASRFNDYGVTEHAVSCGMPLALSLYGERSAQYGRWLTLSGVCNERRNRTAEAEDLYRRGYVALHATVGDVDPDTAWALNNHGLMLMVLGHLDEAERVLSDALLLRIAVHGERHERVASTLRNLGSVERARKNWDKARHYYGLSLANFPAGTPPTDPFRLMTVHNQVRLLRDEGRLEEALTEANDVIEMIRAAEDTQSPQLGRFYDLRIGILNRLKRYNEAYEDCVRRDACVLIAPVDHNTRVDRVVSGMSALRLAGRFDEAAARGQAALAELESADKRGTEAWTRTQREVDRVERDRKRAAQQK